MRKRIKRPSPAMLVAVIALFIAMGGTGYAAATGSIDSREIKNSTIRGKDVKKSGLTGSDIKSSSIAGGDIKNSSLAGRDVKNGSLTGVDVFKDTLTGNEVKESTIGKVPSAGSADRAGSAGSADTLRTFGPATLTEGQTADVVKQGPLTITVTCAANGANTEASVSASSSEANSQAGGDDDADVFGPGSLTFEDPGADDAPGGTASLSDGYDDQFFARAPSGSSLSGTVNTSADADANSCTYSGFAVIVR